MECACFSFDSHAFYQLFAFLCTENNANLHAVSSKRANFDEVQFIKT